MSEQADPYWKLRPPPPTPADELCSCVDRPPLLLQPHLSENPLACIVCNLEVAPELIAFPETLAEKVAHWRRFYDCFYLLWLLDAGEFESWAKVHLEDPASVVNRRGRDVASKLDAFRRTYYSWFRDYGAETLKPPTRCPVCRDALVELFGRHVCEACSIVLND